MSPLNPSPFAHPYLLRIVQEQVQEVGYVALYLGRVRSSKLKSLDQDCAKFAPF